MGLVRVQAIRDWKGDLRASQYRILAFIICHNSLRCNILLTNPKVVNNIPHPGTAIRTSDIAQVPR